MNKMKSKPTEVAPIFGVTNPDVESNHDIDDKRPVCKQSPWFTVTCSDEVRVGLRGDWTIETVPHLEEAIEQSKIKLLRPKQIVFQCGGLKDFDLSGAWILYRLAQYMENNKVTSRYEGFKAAHFKFIESVVSCKEAPKHQIPNDWGGVWVEKFGEKVTKGLLDIMQMIALWGATLTLLAKVISGAKRIRLSAIVHHIEETGVKALPIVSLIVFMISIVLAYQGAFQLTQFGAQIYTVDLVAISILREMSVLLTAIMVAGRSGSAFAAEIGVMKLNEEIDAMKTMGLEPLEVLIVPRFLALLVSLPLLTLVANLSGFVGAALIAVTYMDIPFSLFLERLQDAATLNHFFVGLSKAPVFAVIIAIVSIHQGISVERSAEDIGRYTTRAVVMTIFTVIVADALFSVLYAELQL